MTAPRAQLKASPSTAVVRPYRLTSPSISTAGAPSPTALSPTAVTHAAGRAAYPGHATGLPSQTRPRGGTEIRTPLHAVDCIEFRERRARSRRRTPLANVRGVKSTENLHGAVVAG
ncbi:hypothetical protein Mame01_33700 [Microbispora amethystogenes]|nr:hypothetical protein Mame01_33700 [Microbispora amethystogenes]